jgi:hypothetical protein
MDQDPNIRQAAETFIDRFGDAAIKEADVRARELREAKNAEATAFWVAVKAAVEALLKSRHQRSIH